MGGSWASATGNKKNMSQEDGVHVLERDIVIEAEMEYKNDQGANINELTKANECNILKGK